MRPSEEPDAKSTNTRTSSRAAGIAKRIALVSLIWGGLFAVAYFTNLRDPTPPSRVFHYILGYFVFGWIEDTLPYDTSPTFAKLMMAAFVFEVAAAIAYVTTGKRRDFFTFLGVFVVRMGISFILFFFENSHT